MGGDVRRDVHLTKIIADGTATEVVCEISSDESQTILVVEDEDFVREVTCEVLSSSGHVVLTAKNAAEAKELLQQSSSLPQLLLTDVVLPDQDGCDLARDISAINPDLLVVFMSGYPKNIVSQRLSQQHATYLAKPFSASSLLATVRSVLEQSKVGRQTLKLVEAGGDSW
jgi:two-component system cell cycle sensor histidine kinase/response regulator CckA